MKVILMVDWRGQEILTVKELDERIDAEVEKLTQNTDVYDEYLDDCLDCNYTKKELFDVLSGNEAKREEALADIRSKVAEDIYDYVNMDIKSDFQKITIEV